MRDALIKYYHRNDSKLSETELLDVTYTHTNMTADYQNGSAAVWYNYTKLYYTDYITWKTDTQY